MKSFIKKMFLTKYLRIMQYYPKANEVLGYKICETTTPLCCCITHTSWKQTKHDIKDAPRRLFQFEIKYFSALEACKASDKKRNEKNAIIGGGLFVWVIHMVMSRKTLRQMKTIYMIIYAFIGQNQKLIYISIYFR